MWPVELRVHLVGTVAGPPQSLRASSQPYRSAMESAMFFSLSLLDCGALIWGTTGLSSLFISSNTLSAFCSIVLKLKKELVKSSVKKKRKNKITWRRNFLIWWIKTVLYLILDDGYRYIPTENSPSCTLNVCLFFYILIRTQSKHL